MNSHNGRIYAHTGGVTEAIIRAVKVRNSGLKVIPVKGNRLKECGELLEKIERGSINANFMEGMGCPGGCIGEPGTLIEVDEAAPYVTKFADQAEFFACHDNPTAHGWMEDYYKITDTLSKKMSMEQMERNITVNNQSNIN